MTATKSKIEFNTMLTHDPECRCCGKGREYVCSVCSDYLRNGFMFLLEVKDNSSEFRKYFTGYVVRVKASKVFFNGQPGVAMTPGLYTVRQTDLKNFLKEHYDHRRSKAQNNPQRQAARSTRSATVLRHR